MSKFLKLLSPHMTVDLVKGILLVVKKSACIESRPRIAYKSLHLRSGDQVIA
jgi:hypothetical protein